MADKAYVHAALVSSGTYSRIWDGMLLRIAESYAQRYKKDKDAVKAAKALLHQISAGFISAAELDTAFSLILAKAPEEEILRLHASSRERLLYTNEFYDFIFGGDSSESVLDIGCGLNPLALPYMNLQGGTRYMAADIDTGCLAAIGEYFRINGINGDVFPWDAAAGAPDKTADTALCLKLLPSLELGTKGSAAALLSGLRTKRIAVSFPLKSLGGREKGMLQTYTSMAESLAVQCGLDITKNAVIGRELVFIYKKADIQT